LLAAGKTSEAQSILAKVAALHPNSAAAHYLLAKAHQIRRAHLAQRQELSEAVRLDPSLLRARIELCQLLLSAQAPAAALPLMNETPPQQRSSAAYLLERNWAVLATGDLAEAQRGVSQGLALGRTPDFLLQDALVKTARKDYAGARASQEEALRQDPDDLR